MSDALPSPRDPGREPGASLLRRAQEGSKEAWDRLVGLCAPLVYTWGRRAGLPEAEAADVGEAVFRALADRLGDFRPDRDGGFCTWLGAIAREEIAEHRRRVSPEEESRAEAPVPDVGVGQDGVDAALLYRRAVEMIQGEFPPHVWRAFWAVAVEGRPAAEAAQAQRLTARDIHLARARVRRRLRLEFAGLLDL